MTIIPKCFKDGFWKRMIITNNGKAPKAALKYRLLSIIPNPQQQKYKMLT